MGAELHNPDFVKLAEAYRVPVVGRRRWSQPSAKPWPPTRPA